MWACMEVFHMHVHVHDASPGATVCPFTWAHFVVTTDGLGGADGTARIF